MSEATADLLFPVRFKKKKKSVMVCEEVRIKQLWVYTNHSDGYNIYVLFIVLFIGFIFNFFYCYYIILEKKE